MGLGELPGGVGGVAAAGGAGDALVADDLQVVFDGRNSCSCAVLDQRLELFDVAVALGAFCEHDGCMFINVDGDGGEDGGGDHHDLDTVCGGEVLLSC